MALSFDGPTKTISLSAGTVTMSVRDLWSRWVDWLLTGDNSKYLPALSSLGGDPIDPVAGTYVPVYAKLINGWRIKPQEADHTLDVGDGVLLVDGGGDPFLDTVGDYVVRVKYSQPVQAISYDAGGGSGGLTTQQATQLTEIWQRLGLDAANPVVNHPDGSFDVGDIDVNASEAGGSITQTRQ